MRRIHIGMLLVVATTLPALAGCGSSDGGGGDAETEADAASDADSGADADADADGDADADADAHGDGDADADAEVDADAGPRLCGGIAGLVCADTEWCDYMPSDCGGADTMGLCLPRPEGCSDLYQPVCACDHSVYGNPCDAQAAGLDMDYLDGCTPPAGMFSCGPFFCDLDTTYCHRLVSDVGGIDDSFSCVALPGACGAHPSCACLAGESCGTMCTGEGATGLTVTCPGG